MIYDQKQSARNHSDLPADNRGCLWFFLYFTLFDNLKIKLTSLVDEELFYCQMNSFTVVKAVKHVFSKAPKGRRGKVVDVAISTLLFFFCFLC